jgi:pyrroline-5-carboxylate reductase
MKKTYTIAFVGAGAMGEAMVRGLLHSGVVPGRIAAHDLDRNRLDYLLKTYKVKRARDLAAALEADVVVVAVKPKDLDPVLAGMAAAGAKTPLVISIVAGMTLARFEERLGARARVVRVMPNTPALIGRGVSAYFPGPACSARDAALAEEILAGLGPVHRLPGENYLDAVTGLSGSGPAYVYVMIEALADAGVMMGLPRALAQDLAARTVAGAAEMVSATGMHPAKLKDQVASPGGTTIAGLVELERAGFRAALINAVEAAAKRSKELSG